MIPGLVSITFRKLSPREVVDLVVRVQGKAIEWGGDIHAPHGDVARAMEVAQITRDAGLQVAAYGSYYRLGESEGKGLSFEKVLDSASALGAPTIRVWAGTRGSAETSSTERKAVVDDALRVAGLAEERGVAVSLEYHANTLTDSRASVQQWLTEAKHPNLDFLWQPANGEEIAPNLDRLLDVLPLVRNVHVFHWWPTGAERHPLAAGTDRWQRYLEVLRGTGREMFALIEFVKDDEPEQYVRDAATLREWLAL